MHGNLLVALGLTLFAGLSTGLGGLVVFWSRRPGLRLLSVGLGFSSGVMVFVSLCELLPQGVAVVSRELGHEAGGWVANGAFFGGILVSALIDRLVPEGQNPHEAVTLEDIMRVTSPGESAAQDRPRSLSRVGLLSALVIAIHNFPEGMATFLASVADPALGLSIAIAVAIHNIPEGIAVAVPVYFASGSKVRACGQAFLSGLAEPVGAVAVFLVLRPFITDAVVGSLLALVGGIMVFISFDELLPTAREYGKGHDAIIGLVAGMAVMAVSLLLI
jgi:ZIP family zinc transporter